MSNSVREAVGMEIFARPVDTRPGSIKNRAGFGFKKKKKPEASSGFVKNHALTQTRPDPFIL